MNEIVGDAVIPELTPLDRIAYRRLVFAWCLGAGRHHLKHNALEQALQWDSLAAYVATKDCIPLASAELESHLTDIASRIPVPNAKSSIKSSNRDNWLHIVTVALPYGGHTAMMKRWIETDSNNNTHSIAILEQRSPIPDSLIDAVYRSEGEIIRLEPDASLIDRAARLREYAWQKADVVVLHIYPYDVIASVAFGIPGGPPVLFVNHAAHAFWLGVSVSDLVLNCRASLQEDEWTVKHRNISVERCMRLPIPLPCSRIKRNRGADSDLFKASRAKLGIPATASIVLTVGNTFKYTPLPDLDFIEAATMILSSCPDAYLLAVGIDEDERWLAARKASGGRLRAMGKQYDLEQFHAATDVYIEGFPFGSTTALLEAGLNGIPCVLSPVGSPSPFASDGAALAGLTKPLDIEDYVRRVLHLLDDKAENIRCGLELAAAIEAHHTSSGWLHYLDEIKQKLPFAHRTHSLSDPPPVPWKLVSFWGAFSSLFKEDEFVDVVTIALRNGLRPRLDRNLLAVIHASCSTKRTNLLLNALILLTAFTAAIAPSVTSSPFWHNELFTYLRNNGRIDRVLSGILFKMRLILKRMDFGNAFR